MPVTLQNLSGSRERRRVPARVDPVVLTRSAATSTSSATDCRRHCAPSAAPTRSEVVAAINRVARVVVASGLLLGGRLRPG